MATFEAQVESLTGITISSSSTAPTQAELTQFLRDGLTEVVNRIISIRPEETLKFTKTTNDTNAVNLRGKILSVMREHNSTAVLRKCTLIDPSDRYDASDIDSLDYRSKYNPGFYILNGSIYTVPTAGDATDNDVVVTQVHYDTAIAYGDDEDNIENFPHEYAYLVTKYAAIQSLLNAMGDMQSNSDINTALSAVATEIGLAKADVALAKAEAAEMATQTDNSGDIATALTAINTELDKVDEVIVEASTEFDKCNALLDLGEVDSEAAVNDAAAKIVTEMDETQDLCDLLNAEVLLAITEVGLAKAEAAELATQTDNSGNIETALDAIATTIARFRADGGDPALFGDETQYETGEGMTLVKDALTKAQNLIDGTVMGGDTEPESAQFWLNDEDPEMVQATLTSAQTEIQRAGTHIAEWTTMVQTLSAEIEGFATEVQARAAFSGAKSQAVQSFAATANGYLGTAQAYGTEIQTKLAISQGYIAEMTIRFQQAQTKREESRSRVESGSAFLNEAQTMIAQANGYSTEAQARGLFTGAKAQAVQAFIGSATGYIQTAQSYSNEVQVRMAESNQRYEWFYNRYQMLQNEYNQAFGLIRRQEQEGGEVEG